MMMAFMTHRLLPALSVLALLAPLVVPMMGQTLRGPFPKPGRRLRRPGAIPAGRTVRISPSRMASACSSADRTPTSSRS